MTIISPIHGFFPLIISLLPLVVVRAFISVHESVPIESALAASRRGFGAFVVGECIALSSSPAFAANEPSTANAALPQFLLASQQFQAESSNLPSGLLESRLSSNILEPPPFGMEGTDIFYPS